MDRNDTIMADESWEKLWTLANCRVGGTCSSGRVQVGFESGNGAGSEKEY
jgi:hypothetical protein